MYENMFILYPYYTGPIIMIIVIDVGCCNFLKKKFAYVNSHFSTCTKKVLQSQRAELNSIFICIVCIEHTTISKPSKQPTDIKPTNDFDSPVDVSFLEKIQFSVILHSYFHFWLMYGHRLIFGLCFSYRLHVCLFFFWRVRAQVMLL